MTAHDDLISKPAVAASVAPVIDRRRPGRRNDVNPALLPLLRQQFQDGDAVLDKTWTRPPPRRATPPDDDFAPVRGIITGIVISTALWAGIIALLL